MIKKSNPHEIDRARRALRQATPTVCLHCGRLTLTGDDRDRAALVVEVDAEPVTYLAETVARLAGIETVFVTDKELHARTSFSIMPSPYPVHIRHSCQKGNS